MARRLDRQWPAGGSLGRHRTFCEGIEQTELRTAPLNLHQISALTGRFQSTADAGMTARVQSEGRLMADFCLTRTNVFYNRSRLDVWIAR